jgi:hypothetical protein
MSHFTNNLYMETISKNAAAAGAASDVTSPTKKKTTVADP